MFVNTRNKFFFIHCISPDTFVLSFPPFLSPSSLSLSKFICFSLIFSFTGSLLHVMCSVPHSLLVYLPKLSPPIFVMLRGGRTKRANVPPLWKQQNFLPLHQFTVHTLNNSYAHAPAHCLATSVYHAACLFPLIEGMQSWQKWRMKISFLFFNILLFCFVLFFIILIIPAKVTLGI